MSKFFKDWQEYSCFFSAEYTQNFLKNCYKFLHSTDIEQKSYQNCYPFIYFLENGKLYYQQAQHSPLNIQPILVFYGFVHLIKACLLTIDPTYPNTTSVLSHGVSTRKKKKQQYQFSQDEVKIQKNGLFTYMAEKMFHIKSLEGEKIKMESLFKQIPELTELSYILTGNHTYLPIEINSNRLILPSKILDSYYMNKDRFKLYVEETTNLSISNIEEKKLFLNIELNQTFQPTFPFQYSITDHNYYISIEKNPAYPLQEVLCHYLLLYNLSMIARYEIEWWSEMLKTMPNQDYPFIENFLSISIKKGPSMIFDFLTSRMKNF